METPEALTKNSNKRKISDFFQKSDEKPAKRLSLGGQSTSADVQSLKCPKRKVLVADDDETNGFVAKNKQKRRSFAIKNLGSSQMILDFGQRFGGVTCPDCKMMYSVEAPEDVRDHQKFHDRFINKTRLEIPKSFANLFRFPERTMKNFKVFSCGDFTDESFKKLMREHMKVINEELGYTQNSMENDIWTEGKRVFVVLMTFTTNGKMYIGGVCVVEKITKAWTNRTKKEISEENDVNDWIVGVDRLWVTPECRRTGVGTALLDAATTQTGRMEFRERRLRFAFSDPSDEGTALAVRFLKNHYQPVDQFDGEILVY